MLIVKINIFYETKQYKMSAVTRHNYICNPGRVHQPWTSITHHWMNVKATLDEYINPGRAPLQPWTNRLAPR